MACFRGTLTDISAQAKDIIMNSWSHNTKRSYDPYIKEWAIYCNNNNVTMEMARHDVNLGIDFLTHLFRVENAGYSAVNNARSALSAFIITGSAETFGNLPLVSRLLKGMFREKPSLPRYAVTYDVNVLLEYIKKLPATNPTFKQLTYKLVMLLCLLTGHRDQTLSELNLDYMHREPNRVIFYVHTILKNTTQKYHARPLALKGYAPDASICVVTTIEALYQYHHTNAGRDKKAIH